MPLTGKSSSKLKPDPGSYRSGLNPRPRFSKRATLTRSSFAAASCLVFSSALKLCLNYRSPLNQRNKKHRRIIRTYWMIRSGQRQSDMKREIKPNDSNNLPQTPGEDFYVTDFRATEQALDTLALQICCQPKWKRVWLKIKNLIFKPKPIRPQDINYFPPIDERVRYAWLTDEKDPKPRL